LQNLIANAIKFHGDAPPVVSVSCDGQNGEWHFSVKDNGIGIAPQYRERVFELFQRLHGRGKLRRHRHRSDQLPQGGRAARRPHLG
jgi:light-regulated signal transduction histidine kinase (bacteriophytochrome)